MKTALCIVVSTTVIIRGLYESLPTWSQYLYYRSKCFEKSCFSTVIFVVFEIQNVLELFSFHTVEIVSIASLFSLFYLKTRSSWTKSFYLRLIRKMREFFSGTEEGEN